MKKTTEINQFFNGRKLKNKFKEVSMKKHFTLIELLVEAPAWTEKIRCGTNYTVYSVRAQELSDKKS